MTGLEYDPAATYRIEPPPPYYTIKIYVNGAVVTTSEMHVPDWISHAVNMARLAGPGVHVTLPNGGGIERVGEIYWIIGDAHEGNSWD